MNVKKLIGLGVFLLGLYVLLLLSDEGARSWQNHYNLLNRLGLYGVISLGVGGLIISGGIDLSIGSVVGLCSTLLAMMLVDYQWPPAVAILAVLALGCLIGLANGLIVTKLRVQAFVVTLCGLFIFRGIARWVAGDMNKGLGVGFQDWKYWLSSGRVVFGLPQSFVILLLLAAAIAIFWHFSVAGRYLYAIGSNEQAARYSGVRTDRYKILAYVISSGLAAFFSVLFLMEQNSVQPSSTGSFFELYAIAGAVLGGCSLRGGEGNVIGVLMGTAILWMLPNLTHMMGIPTALQDFVVGFALLIGTLVDAVDWRRFGAAKRLFAPKAAR